MPNVMKCKLVKTIVLRLPAFCDTERLLAHELLRDTEWTHVSHMNEEDRVVVRDQIRKGEKFLLGFYSTVESVEPGQNQVLPGCCRRCCCRHCCRCLGMFVLLDSEREWLTKIFRERAASSAVHVKPEGDQVDGGHGRDAVAVIETKVVTRPLSDTCRHLLYELELCKKDLVERGPTGSL
ncbi:hypothetical protein PAMP_009638 [Pampus punctatissimus]